MNPDLLLKRELVRHLRKASLTTPPQLIQDALEYGVRVGYLTRKNTGFIAGTPIISYAYARTNIAQHLAFLCVEHDDCLANEALGFRCWETQTKEKWEAFAKLKIPCSQCGNQPTGCFCT